MHVTLNGVPKQDNVQELEGEMSFNRIYLPVAEVTVTRLMTRHSEQVLPGLQGRWVHVTEMVPAP